MMQEEVTNGWKILIYPPSPFPQKQKTEKKKNPQPKPKPPREDKGRKLLSGLGAVCGPSTHHGTPAPASAACGDLRQAR